MNHLLSVFFIFAVLFSSIAAQDRQGSSGTTDAAAGKVGAYVANTVLAGSAVSVPSGTTVNITSISLPAGDWDVSCVLRFSNGGGAATQWSGGISTTSATLPTADLLSAPSLAAGTLTDGRTRIKVTTTTTVYLVASYDGIGGTPVAWGKITARFVR